MTICDQMQALARRLAADLDNGRISASDARAAAPTGYRIEIQPAVLLVWSFASASYTGRARRA